MYESLWEPAGAKPFHMLRSFFFLRLRFRLCLYPTPCQNTDCRGAVFLWSLLKHNRKTSVALCHLSCRRKGPDFPWVEFKTQEVAPVSEAASLWAEGVRQGLRALLESC